MNLWTLNNCTFLKVFRALCNRHTHMRFSLIMMIDGRPLNCIQSDLNHAKYFFVTFPQYSFSLARSSR